MYYSCLRLVKDRFALVLDSLAKLGLMEVETTIACGGRKKHLKHKKRATKPKCRQAKKAAASQGLKAAGSRSRVFGFSKRLYYEEVSKLR